MPTDWPIYACLAIGLGNGLVAGVFQSFSDFVMKSLIAAHPASGIEAMQWINRNVFRSLFLIMMLGLAPVTLATAIYANGYLAGPAVSWITAGAAIYLTCVFLVTLWGNVPMNERLDKMPPSAFETAGYWRTYGIVWTRWNHVRTLGSAATAACYLLAAVALP